jgi:hypothetical protein
MQFLSHVMKNELGSNFGGKTGCFGDNFSRSENKLCFRKKFGFVFVDLLLLTKAPKQRKICHRQR